MRDEIIAGSLLCIHSENKDNDDDDEDATMKPPAITASASWPCANCQTTVSSERCPTCHGIQVRILDNQKDDLSRVWLERLSPAIFRSTGTPTPDECEFRPLDPVACVLASAPSPVVDEKKVVKLKEIEDCLRNKRPMVTDLRPSVTKKSKWLSAV